VQIRDKLYDTRELLFHCSSHPTEDIVAVLTRFGGFVDTKELMDVLKLFHRSLIQTGDDGVANGAVLDAIRQVQVFGSSLVRLDIRQESTRHREVMSAITEFLDLGSFEKWSEEDRTQFLLKELQVLPATC
jgi:phosphoenolpyruvate carboxylase